MRKGLNKLNTLVKVGIVYILYSLNPAPFYYASLFAQTTEQCDTILAQAEEQYTLGNWNNAIELIQQCIQKKDASDADKGKAYRLLGLVYIATEFEKDAKEAIKNLLILAPNYQINPDEDPPQFQKIISDISLLLIPKIDNITPNTSQRNELGIKIKVTGSNFAYGSKVQIDGEERVTEYFNSGELAGDLTAEDLMKGGEHEVSIYSPILGGKQSNLVKFIVDTTSTTTGLRIILNGALSLPIGDFADDKGNEGDGFATLGFGAFVDLHVPFVSPGLGWFSSLGFIYNGYNTNDLDEFYSELGYQAKNEITGYMNIPVLTGISYIGNLSTSLSYIINGQVALSFINGPDITSKLTSVEYSGTVEVSYDMTTSFGFGAGAGLIINDMFILSCRYLNFGKAERDFTIDVTLQNNYTGETASDRETGSEDQSVSVLIFSLGVMF